MLQQQCVVKMAAHCCAVLRVVLNWCTKHASFDRATLLLQPFPHRFLRARFYPQYFAKTLNNGEHRTLVTQACEDLVTKKHLFLTRNKACPKKMDSKIKSGWN